MAKDFGYDIDFYESRFTPETAYLAKGSEAVCLFVTDKVDEAAAKALEEVGVKVILLRSAGFDHVDLAACAGRLTVLRVPSYSPEAIAEFGAALLLTLARRVHRAYLRTRSFDFRLNHLMGVTLRGKTAGIIGTGRIGKLMIEILQGLGMKILAYDMFPDQKLEVEYVPLETLFAQSDVISLHCPLTPETKYMIDEKAIEQHIRGILVALGDDPEREGLIDTPKRVAKMYTEVFAGMQYTNHDIAEMFGKVFEEERVSSNNVVVMKDIDLFSYCEHHLALMYDMKATVAYIPKGKVIGLSKIARICDMVGRRLQLQERIGCDIADIISEITGSEDIAVILEGYHSCVTIRGIQKTNTKTVTVERRGKFLEDATLQLYLR